MKKSNILQIVVRIVAGLAAGYLIWWIVPAYFQKATGAGSFERLTQEAEHLNRGLPAMLDKETELMVTEAAPGMFIYKYRLVNVVAGCRRFGHPHGARVSLAVALRQSARREGLSKFPYRRCRNFEIDPARVKYSLHGDFPALCVARAEPI